MKKLLKFMACALAVSFGLTACDKGEESHHPYDSGYKPKGSQLNTSHKLVGQMYGVDGVVTDPADAQGIVFAVSKDGSTAYLVAFTDAMVVGGNTPNNRETFCFYNPREGESGYFSLQMLWGLTVPSKRDTIITTKTENGVVVSDTTIKTRGIINNVDGEINTNQIMELFAETARQDSTITVPSVYAAKLCRDYYRRQWGTALLDADDPIAQKWASTKGEWYLPSIEELGDLMKNRDKINKKYYGKNEGMFVDKTYFFMPIGGENGHAYWSSSEFNQQAAWYCLSRVGNGTDYSGNKRYGYFQKNDKQNMYARPIRKAPIR